MLSTTRWHMGLRDKREIVILALLGASQGVDAATEVGAAARGSGAASGAAADEAAKTLEPAHSPNANELINPPYLTEGLSSAFRSPSAY
jgi:hypothetical protein